MKYTLLFFLSIFSAQCFAQRSKQKIDPIARRKLIEEPVSITYENIGGGCWMSLRLSLVDSNCALSTGYNNMHGMGFDHLLTGIYRMNGDTMTITDSISGISMVFKKEGMALLPLKAFDCLKGGKLVETSSLALRVGHRFPSCTTPSNVALITEFSPGHYSCTYDRGLLWFCFGKTSFSLLFDDTFLLEGTYSNSAGVLNLYTNIKDNPIKLYHTEDGLIADSTFPWPRYCRFTLLKD